VWWRPFRSQRRSLRADARFQAFGHFERSLARSRRTEVMSSPATTQAGVRAAPVSRSHASATTVSW
jgi:hypothetical protein